MPNIKLLHELVQTAAGEFADRDALIHRAETLTYRALCRLVGQWCAGLLGLELGPGDRVGVYLPKQLNTVGALLGTSAAGGVFVPLNPLLKPFQVAYILNDCTVRILVTSAERANLLAAELAQCPDLNTVVLVDGSPADIAAPLCNLCVALSQFLGEGGVNPARHRRIDADLALVPPL